MVDCAWAIDAREGVDRASDPLRRVRAAPRSSGLLTTLWTNGGGGVEVVVGDAVWRGVLNKRDARDDFGPRRDIERAVIVGVEILAVEAGEVPDEKNGDVVRALKIE